MCYALISQVWPLVVAYWMGEFYRPALVYYRANGLKFLKLVEFTDVSCSFLSTRLESILFRSKL
jgi:hypothetical protein